GDVHRRLDVDPGFRCRRGTFQDPAQPPGEEVMTGTGRQLDQPAVDELVGPAVVGQPVQVLDRVGPVAAVVADTHWLLSSLAWQPIATTRLVRPPGQHDRAAATGSPPAYHG